MICQGRVPLGNYFLSFLDPHGYSWVDKNPLSGTIGFARSIWRAETVELGTNRRHLRSTFQSEFPLAIVEHSVQATVNSPIWFLFFFLLFFDLFIILTQNKCYNAFGLNLKHKILEWQSMRLQKDKEAWFP